MKSTGIVRRIDELGRVVLPKELRRTLGVDSRDEVEIYVNGDKIMVRKYEPACTFCGESENVIEFMNRKVCHKCIELMPRKKSEVSW